MREPTAPSRTTAALLGLLPAALITATMSGIVAAAPGLELPALHRLYELALLLNVAVWFAFAPAYLYGWVQLWDPLARARTGRVGLAALTAVAWLGNVLAYGVAGGALASLLRG
jgi:hypothetical protein